MPVVNPGKQGENFGIAFQYMNFDKRAARGEPFAAGGTHECVHAMFVKRVRNTAGGKPGCLLRQEFGNASVGLVRLGDSPVAVARKVREVAFLAAKLAARIGIVSPGKDFVRGAIDR